MGVNHSCLLPHRARKRGGVPSSTGVKTLAGTNTAALTSTGNRLPAGIDTSDAEDLNFVPPNTLPGKPSENAPFFCEICTDIKTVTDSSFTNSNCSHVYCCECAAAYVGSKLQENVINISCPVPECSGLLVAEDFRAILPAEVLERWLTALIEASIAGSVKFYCPFVDCSALLIDDGMERVWESECPNCRKLFCAQCKVPWHAEFTCDEFQKLNQDERWKLSATKLTRCPNCRDYVTKSDDCDPIICRCGYAEGNIGEAGESSNDAPFTCEICTDTKTAWDSFGITGCSHAYCSDCVAMYVRSKVEENVVNIRCPVSGCVGLLEAEDCRGILPAEVFDRWGKASSEALFAESVKFYCPFKDCSALMIDDGAEVVRESECPNCKRLFCAQCKAPWHDGVKCDEFQKLNQDERGKEDLMLIKLANKKQWMRCPNCKLFVAKSHGCMYIKCRCGYAFCYRCGTPNTNSKTHYCDKCRRTY